MSDRHSSIFYSAFRAFFVAIFSFIGIGVGLIILAIIIAALSTTSKSTEELELTNKVIILPDANGSFKKLDSSSPVILRLNISGVIGATNLNMNKVRTILAESRLGDLKEDRVKGILVYMDSPGGTVTDSDGIYNALKEYKAKYKVPVYTYVDGLCASGGMYIACATDKIFASNVSLVGSVGVLFPTFLNFSQLLEKWSIQTLTLSAGKEKDAMNPLRPWQKDEEVSFQYLVDYYYQYFIDIVTSNRPQMSKEKLVNEYGARVFNASAAKEHGYIDELNNDINVALRDVVKAAGLEEKDYQFVELEESNWFRDLLKAESPIFTGKIKHTFQMSADDLDPSMVNKILYLYRPIN